MFSGFRGPQSNAMGPSNYIEPKHAPYISNGAGRDSYIIYNNGGLIVPKIYSGCKETNRGFFGTLKKSHSPTPTLTEKSICYNYVLNGSGRDTYIMDANGQSNNKSYQCNPVHRFHETLR
jgi:hypothetical protein